jgi:hypothetical protein
MANTGISWRKAVWAMGVGVILQRKIHVLAGKMITRHPAHSQKL